jgi:hypothetical protein
MKNYIKTLIAKKNIYSGKLGLFFLFFLLHIHLFPQNSTQPTPPSVTFTNSVNFNFNQKQFNFNYQGTDGNISYKYSPIADGSLSALQCIVNSTYTFTPSLGGMSLDAGGNEVFSWTAGVTFTLLNTNSSADTLFASWKMQYGAYSLLYNYKIFISARTLVIGVTAQNPIAAELTLERCKNVLNPKTIPIPYLPFFNVLYTNNVFVSMFFDWEKTGASEINSLDDIFSSTSVYYSQYARYSKNTNGIRNLVNEKIYLTTSPSLTDVLPNIPNPVSTLKSVSSNHIVFDSWHYGFSTALNDVMLCHNAGINNLWVIIHNWQYGGYDNMYPDVMPANVAQGGNSALIALSDSCANYNYLFALHENYVDFYPNAPSYNQNDLSKNPDGSFKLSWYNPSTGIQAYQMKPSKSANYLNIFSPQIHQSFSTTASFLDVHSAANPSNIVDYDANVANSGTFKQTMQLYRQLAGLLRTHHTGPVSGEGYYHFLYAGYFDDAEAQINTGKQNGYWQSCRLPLLVDFQLNKIHSLMCVHGVGYYERFFSLNGGAQSSNQFPLDTTLIYIATELAYGNAGFIPFSDRVTNFLAVAKLEYKHVLPAQQLYANASVVSITYDDNGQAIDASQYIKNHPTTFDDITSVDFMSKVKVVYNNGTVVYVNRHPTQSWQVTPGVSGSSFNYHAIINSIDSLGVDSTTTITTWTLPSKSGWLVIASQQITGVFNTENTGQNINLFPNPATSEIQINLPVNINLQIEIYNSLGQLVVTQKNSNSVDISKLVAGIYFVRATQGSTIYCHKLIKQ